MGADEAGSSTITAAREPRTQGEAYNLCDGAGGTWREYVDGLADELHLKRPWLNLPYAAAAALARAMELPWKLFAGLGGRPLLTRHAVVLLGRDQEFPIAQAQADFGFVPTIYLREGLRRSAEWVRRPES